MSINYSDFLRSLIHILEAKKMYFPRFVYCLMICVMYTQFAGYVFCTYESKPLLDPKIVFFAHWNEYSTGTFLLFVAANDLLTLLCFWFFQAMLYCYFFYIIILTLLDHYFPHFKAQHQTVFDILNTFYQFFFSSFLWIFYVPFTEINSGIIVCGNNSFLVQYRTGSCSEKPVYFTLLGILGLVLTFFTGAILSYFYVNYQFLEKNFLKRRFQPNLIIQLFARSLLIFLYYLDISNIFVVKHICSHILGLTSCYDFLLHLPFRDKFVCTFYGCVTLIYEFSMVLFSFWELTSFLEEFNIFFCWIFGCSFLIAFTILYVRVYYFNATLLLPGSLTSSNIHNLDVLLEEIMELTLRSESDKGAKLEIQGLMQRMEEKLPPALNFFKRKRDLKQILSENQQIDTVKIVKIINELFCIFLKDPQVVESKAIYEYLSLKYCSFLGAYQDNPIKAYYELKSLLSMNTQQVGSNLRRYKPSVIFLIISQVITQNIQHLLIETFKIRYEMEITLSGSEKSEHNELVWKTLPKSEEIKLSFVSKMAELVKLKLKFWESLCMGYNRMDDFLRECLKLMRKIENFSADFSSNLNETNLPGLESNVIYLKLMCIYYLMILNDNIKAKLYEEKLKEIKKNDAGLKEGCVNSFSILSGNSIVIQISLLREKGRIVNQKTERMARFFGYSHRDFQSLYSIHSLMPDSLAKSHPMFLNRFIKNGPSKHFVKGKTVFGMQSQGFIFPLRLNLNLTFVDSEDFVVSSILTKSNESSFTFVFNELGDILGISESLSKQIPNGLNRKNVFKIYECYKIFWLMPELLEQLPQPETMKKLSDKKESISELITNGRVSVYFPKDIEPIFEFIAKYKIKNEQTFKNLKKYSDLFQKESKTILKKFCYFGNTKPLLNKKLARYSLRNELYFTSNKKFLSYFILTIHELYETDNLQDMDFLSYSIEKTNTTQTSQYTFLTMRSEKQQASSVVDKQEEVKPIEFKKESNENLKMENLPKDSKDNKELIPEKKLEPPQIGDNNNPNENDINNKIPEQDLHEDDKSDKNENDERISEDARNNETDDEEFMVAKEGRQESSIHSTSSSSFNNKGLIFISGFIKHGKIMLLLKKIFLILGFQIMVFFFIDVIYIILIKSKFDEYYSTLTESTNPVDFLNHYCKTLLGASSYQLARGEYLAPNDLNVSAPSLAYLISSSYYGMQESLSQPYLLTKSTYQDIIMVRFVANAINNATESQTLPFIAFMEKIQSLIFSLMQDNGDIMSYLEVRANFNIFTKETYRISQILLEQMQSGKDSFTAFYIYLTVTGIISALFLQILSFPFYKKYYKYLEKVLVLVTRLQEKECDNELYKLKHFLHFLESNEETYMTMGITKLEGERKWLRSLEKKNLKSEDNNNEYERRAKKAKKSNYLTSRINNHQINMRSFKIVILLAVIVVTGYYGGAFLFLFQINNYLNYANKIMEFTNSLYWSSNSLKLSKRFLVDWYYVRDQAYVDKDDIANLKWLFNESMKNMQSTLEIRIDIPNGEVPDSYLEGIKTVLNNDSCHYAVNFGDCALLDQNSFKFGLRSYMVSFLNKIVLQQSQIMSHEKLSIDDVRSLLSPEATMFLGVLTYKIMEETLNILEVESTNSTQDLLNALYNNLFLLFVLGGILCSLVWGLLALLRMKKMWNEIHLSKKLLILIPINKLNEESTLHLMKNLENI